MFKLLFRIAFIILFFCLFSPNNSWSADVHKPTNFPIMMGVTDDSNKFTRFLKLDGSDNLYVNVASGGFSGSATPTDAFTNPTDAVKSWSLLGSYNGTGWDKLRTAYADGMATTGILATGLMGWNGTGFDRVVVDGNKAIRVNTGALDHVIDNLGVLPATGVTAINIVTETSTMVNAAAGDLLKVVVGVGVASSNFKIFNDATGSCDTDQIGGIFDTATTGLTYNLGLPLSTGICILTVGTSDLTVFYRDNP